MADRLGELTRVACELALQARENCGRSVRIAGSLPPLDISYRNDLVGPREEILSQYREISALLEPHVDILLCETMSTAAEARAAATAALETGKPVWVSWTLLGSAVAELPSGESVAEAKKAVADLAVTATLVNCCSTDAATEGLAALRGDGDRLIGAYANRVRRPGRDAGPENVLDVDGYASVIAGWIECGADIVGGCCSVRPADIAKIRSLLGPPSG